MTSFALLRDVGENLGRFASARDKADIPSDRIVVQANQGTLKMIAGDYRKTIIADLGPTEQSGRAVVSSKALLGALKTFKSKGEAEFTPSDAGLTIKTGFGSSVDLPGLEMPKYLRPVPQVWSPDAMTVPFEADFLPKACKYLSMCVGDFSPFNQVYGHANGTTFTLEAADNHIRAVITALPAMEAFKVHFPGEDFNALRGLGDSGHFWFPDRVGTEAYRGQVYAGRYQVVMVLYPAYPAYPAQDSFSPTAKVFGNKKTIIETFKALAGRHQYSRVVMKASGGAFTVTGGDTGAVKIDAEVAGSATLPVNATYLAKVLTAVDGKNATIEYADSPSLVRVTGDANQWPVLIAPMK